MRKTDFKSVVIGFLLAVIFFLVTGQKANDKVAEYEYIKAARIQVGTLDVTGLQAKMLVVTGSMGLNNEGKMAVYIGTTSGGEGAIYLFDSNNNPVRAITGKK